MSNDSVIKLVCFDLGGVLIRICRTWQDGCKAAGLNACGDVLANPMMLEQRHEFSHQYQLGLLSSEAYFQAIAVTTGCYLPHEIARIHDAWLLGEYPGVGAVVEHLHAAGLRTAALSNTNHAHWTRMHEFPAVMRLQCRLASHQLGLAKPETAIFQEAQRRFGVHAHEILFFDDLAENVAAAREIGWRAVHIDYAADTAQQIRAAAVASGISIPPPVMSVAPASAPLRSS